MVLAARQTKSQHSLKQPPDAAARPAGADAPDAGLRSCNEVAVPQSARGPATRLFDRGHVLYRSLEGGKKQPAGLRNLPAGRVAQNKCAGKDVEAGRARRQAFCPVGPVRAAGNQNGHRASELVERRTSPWVSRQDLQNRDLKTHRTPRYARP